MTRTQDDEEGPDKHEPGIDHSTRSRAGISPTPPSAIIIHEIIRDEGEDELDRSVKALIWSASGAGLSMGFSFFTMGIIRSGLPDSPWSKLVTAFGYTIGFLIVVLGRQQLFTESTLTAVLPLLTRRDWKTFVATARLWTIVLVFNILGTFVFSWLISHQALFSHQIDEAFATLAAEAIRDSFWPMLIKAILAGWLIAMMVWLIPGAGQARLWIVVIITWVVAASQFSHIIAGSVEASYNVWIGHITLGHYFTGFMIPTLIGNCLGGVSLVAVLNHVPVREELPGGKGE